LATLVCDEARDAFAQATAPGTGTSTGTGTGTGTGTHWLANAGIPSLSHGTPSRDRAEVPA